MPVARIRLPVQRPIDVSPALQNLLMFRLRDRWQPTEKQVRRLIASRQIAHVLDDILTDQKLHLAPSSRSWLIAWAQIELARLQDLTGIIAHQEQAGLLPDLPARYSFPDGSALHQIMERPVRQPGLMTLAPIPAYLHDWRAVEDAGLAPPEIINWLRTAAQARYAMLITGPRTNDARWLARLLAEERLPGDRLAILDHQTMSRPATGDTLRLLAGVMPDWTGADGVNEVDLTEIVAQFQADRLWGFQLDLPDLLVYAREACVYGALPSRDLATGYDRLRLAVPDKMLDCLSLRVDLLLELLPQPASSPRLTRIARIEPSGAFTVVWEAARSTELPFDITAPHTRLAQPPEADVIPAANQSYTLLAFHDGRAVLDHAGQAITTQVANAQIIAASAAAHFPDPAHSGERLIAPLAQLQIPDGPCVTVLQGAAAASGTAYLIEHLTDEPIPLATQIARRIMTEHTHVALVGPRSLYRALLVRAIRRALQAEGVPMFDRDHLHQMGAPAAGLTCFSTRITAHNWLAVRQFAQHESVVLLAEVDHRQPGDMARAFKDRTGNDSLDLFGQVWSVERLARRRYRVTDQST